MVHVTSLETADREEGRSVHNITDNTMLIDNPQYLRAGNLKQSIVSACQLLSLLTDQLLQPSTVPKPLIHNRVQKGRRRMITPPPPSPVKSAWTLEGDDDDDDDDNKGMKFPSVGNNSTT